MVGSAMVNYDFYKIIFLLAWLPPVASNLGIDHCKQEWVKVSRTTYSYRVDCSNLGFEHVPDDLPALTSELRLNGNSISSLDDQAFAGLASLHTLDLSGNDIETIDESVFKTNSLLKKLYLSRNKIRCDARIWWLVGYAKKLSNFSGICFSPRPLRSRSILSLTVEDLSVDCVSVKRLNNASSDGEYHIRVFGRDNSNTEICIYCHGMDSSVPKEFLTLPAGIHHNYVEIRTSDRCDYNNSDAALQKKLDALGNAESSYFVRVRIDLLTLQIDTTDTTFGYVSDPTHGSASNLIKFGQPAVCGNKICTGGVSKIDLRGTYFHLKEGSRNIVRRHCDAEKCGSCQTSSSIELNLMDPRKYPFLGCTLPLGMQSYKIQNTSINASSSVAGMDPYHARLNNRIYAGWCAEYTDEHQYILVDLGVEKTLSGISTQGYKTAPNWVTRYKLLYSSSAGKDFRIYKEFGKAKTLTGNTDSNTVVTHWFQPRFRARYVMVHPIGWSTNGTDDHHICMRLEFYGCASDITSYIIKPQLSNKCITIDMAKKRDYNPVILGTECYGPDYMFTFSTKRVMHTQTGLCMHLSDSNELMLNQDCSSSEILFQKVRQKNAEAFLIKDMNGKCARIYQNRNLQIDWKWCLQGGFTIFHMSRDGVSPFSPSFADTDSIITTDLFQTVKLVCRVHADPLTIFRWSKHSRTVAKERYNVFKNGEINETKHRSVLKFSNISWYDRGDYYCDVWNSNGNATKKYEINVNAIQWFALEPSNEKIIYGYTAIFNCISKGIPDPRIEWRKYNSIALGNPLTISGNHSRYHILKNGSLVIREVKYSDQGIYMCVSMSPKLIRNASAELDVYVTQKFTAKPKPAHVLFSQGTMFDCISEGLPKPVVEWKMDLNNVDRLVTIDESLKHQYEILQNNSLLVKSVTIADEGDFICVSTSPGLVVNVTASLTVFVTQNFTKSPVDQKVFYGYNATFECVSVGTPKPLVKWAMILKDGFQVLKANNKYYISDTALHIYNVQYEDEATYACLSYSPRMNRNVSAELDVYVTQNFTKVPTSLRLYYGYNATFECISEGIPKPKVYWLRIIGNRFQEVIGNKKTVISQTALHIYEVNYKDAGKYICFSESPGLTRNISVHLDVYVTQNFTKAPAYQKVLYGYNATFECESVGIPKPATFWARKVNNVYQKLNSSDKYVMSIGTLLIRDVDYEDEGEYACFSKSPGLLVNASAELDVYVTQSFDVEPIGGRVLYGNNYTLHCVTSGIPRPRLTWKFRRAGSKTIETLQNSDVYSIAPINNLTLHTVKLKESGDYLCVSESPGLTVNASVFVEVYVTQEFTKIPLSQKLIKGKGAVFHCESVGSPPPVISWKYQRLNSPSFETITVDARIAIHTDNSLVIDEVQNSDEGSYICISESPGLTVNVTAQLIVYIPPTIKMSAKSAKLLIGQKTEVTCEVAGDPIPTINWLKNVNGVATSLGYTKEKLVFEKAAKSNQSQYTCVASNVVGDVRASYDLQVDALCLLDPIENSVIMPAKYEYKENEDVVVECLKGFRMMGNNLLTCTGTGRFNDALPICVDINECNDTYMFGSGLTDNEVPADDTDDEPEVCDEYAQCINNIGSYECICEEGYEMVNKRCEFAPPGSESTRGDDGIRATTTPPPSRDYHWLNTLNSFYRRNVIDEEKYLRKLQRHSAGVKVTPYNKWKVSGIIKLIEALELAVEKARNSDDNSDSKKIMQDMQAFSSIVNDVLDIELKEQWKIVNERTNGSVLIMKYLEEYILLKAEALSESGFKGGDLKMYSSNLDMKIVPVKERDWSKPYEITMSQEDATSSIDIPPENYRIFNNSVGVAILYKHLHELFPTPKIDELERSKIHSKLFTMAFTSPDTNLLKPVQIKFKMGNDVLVPDKRFCSYWDFNKPYGGGWSTEGCQTLNISTATEVICECTHLTSFAVIVPQKTALKVVYLTFTLSVAVGVTCCVILAFCTCMSHVCCASYMTSDRQTILTNITVVIILGLLVFAAGVFISSMKLIPPDYSTYFCFSLIGIMQLLAVAFFGWIFAESIHVMFSMRTTIEKANSHLCLFYILGWAVPLGLLVITGVLVYFDKFQLQSRCSLHVSFYLVGILVGAPSLCYIIGTVTVYIIICFSSKKNGEILGPVKVAHASRVLLYSGFLIMFHLASLVAVTVFLHYNRDKMYHHILGGVAAAEGVYLIIYHMFLDRMVSRSKNSSPRSSRQRNSYSTKEVITYAPNGSIRDNEKPEQDTNEKTRFLIKSSSKRSVDSAKLAQSMSRNDDISQHNTLEWDNHVGGNMYGTVDSSESDADLRHTLKKQQSEDVPDTIFEDDKDFAMETALPTFGQPCVSRGGTIPRSYSSLPRKKPMTRDYDEVSNDGSFRPTRRAGKASSIVSIETHTSQSSQQGIPVYFPSAPPHHEIRIDNKGKQRASTRDDYPESVDPSRPGSFGIDEDRMSNLSAELSGILYELQAFNTDRHPSESQPMIDESNANTLPRRVPQGGQDLSNTLSTFKPNRGYAKTEVQYTDEKPANVEHHRVRVLRGRSRQEADPADGLHGTTDSIYSSL